MERLLLEKEWDGAGWDAAEAGGGGAAVGDLDASECECCRGEENGVAYLLRNRSGEPTAVWRTMTEVA